MAELIFILGAFLVAGWVQGVIGFGFAIATTLLLVNQVNFTMLVFLNLSMSVLTSLFAMLSGKNLKAIHQPTLWRLILSAGAGLVFGIMILNLVDALLLKQITLGVILVASLVSLRKKVSFFSYPAMAWVSGFFSGVLTPSTGINGPLVALHLNAAFQEKTQTRTTMLAYLFLIMAFGVVFMGFQQQLPAQTWQMLPKIILPSAIGYGLGMLSFRLLSDAVFKKIVTFFLIASSVLSFIYLIF
ncbi:MAG: sulfite exporter TauE/SafE family protein [Adhaeribacter sp.]